MFKSGKNYDEAGIELTEFSPTLKISANSFLLAAKPLLIDLVHYAPVTLTITLQPLNLDIPTLTPHLIGSTEFLNIPPLNSDWYTYAQHMIAPAIWQNIHNSQPGHYNFNAPFTNFSNDNIFYTDFSGMAHHDLYTALRKSENEIKKNVAMLYYMFRGFPTDLVVYIATMTGIHGVHNEYNASQVALKKLKKIDVPPAFATFSKYPGLFINRPPSELKTPEEQQSFDQQWGLVPYQKSRT
ncbi:MAG: hypothetical protein KBD83_01075 [Gammaproteobacteria bacterium]|nr:hypothetical protein [Gammaproteobacteria bacterium]